jgi:hypothetical protein
MTYRNKFIAKPTTWAKISINEEIKMKAFAPKLPEHKTIEATLKEANSYAGLDAGKPVPNGPVADRDDPKVTRTVAADPVAMANSSGGNLAKGDQVS